MKPTTAQRLTAEAVGTFFVTLIPTAIDVLYYTGQGVEDVSRWLARGFGVAAVIFAFSDISGAHVDPAVTVAFAIRRVMPARLAIAYIAAQFGGALVAAALGLLLFGREALALGASHPGPHVTAGVACAVEVVSTFAVMLVILMMSQQQQATVAKQAAVAVGFIVATCGFVAGPLSGASMNPARTIAPAILSASYANIWIYAVGPVLGAALAVPVHFMLCGAPTKAQKQAAKGAGIGNAS